MSLYLPIREGHANELWAELEGIAYLDLDAGREGRLRETKELRGRPVSPPEYTSNCSLMVQVGYKV